MYTHSALEDARLESLAEKVRKDPSELTRMPPALAHSVARYMTPMEKPKVSIPAPHPNPTFDGIIKMETENPEGYRDTVSRMNPVTRLAFSRYSDAKAAQKQVTSAT